MTFQLTDLLLFPAIVQGFLIAALLLLKKNGDFKLNVVLSLFMISSAFMLIGRMVYARFPDDWMVQIALIPDLIIFLFGPLSYFFISHLLTGQPVSKKIIHFIPGLVYGLIIVFFFTVGSSLFAEIMKNGVIWRFFFYVELLGLLSNIAYTAISLRILIKYKTREKERLSYQQSSVLFVSVFILSLIICETLWLSSFISISFFKYFLPFISYSVVWFSMPFVSYVIGYFMLSKPQLFQISVGVDKKAKMRLHSDSIEKLKIGLSQAMLKEQLYAIDNLTLKQLSEKLDTSPNNLSWLLNDVYDQSFYDFINAHRVNAFLEKIENGEHIQKTILSLAIEVGFRSKSTFNKAFKLIHDCTPSEFIKTHYAAGGNLRYSA